MENIGEFVDFQVQWTRYDGSSKVNISYLFWTLRMSSLCIFGPFSFCPLSVHCTHFLRRMAVLVDSVSNATMSHPSLNAMIPITMCIEFVMDVRPSSYPVLWSNVMSMFKIRKRVGFAGLVGECVGNRSLEVEARCGQSQGKLLWTVTSGWS